MTGLGWAGADQVAIAEAIAALTGGFRPPPGF